MDPRSIAQLGRLNCIKEDVKACNKCRLFFGLRPQLHCLSITESAKEAQRTQSKKTNALYRTSTLRIRSVGWAELCEAQHNDFRF